MRCDSRLLIDNRPDSISSGIAKPAAEGTGGNRNRLGGQRNGSDDVRNGSTLRMGNVGIDSSLRAIVAWCGSGGGHGGTTGGGSRSSEDGTASTSSSG